MAHYWKRMGKKVSFVRRKVKGRLEGQEGEVEVAA